MNAISLLQVTVAMFAMLVLAAVFLLYQNPLFEIYLSSWGLC